MNLRQISILDEPRLIHIIHLGRWLEIASDFGLVLLLPQSLVPLIPSVVRGELLARLIHRLSGLSCFPRIESLTMQPFDFVNICVPLVVL
jgi:hypothetical protein